MLDSILSEFNLVHTLDIPSCLFPRRQQKFWKRFSFLPRSGFVQHIISNVTYSGFSIHDGTLLHSKSQYTTVKHSQ
jgi:hypothetical protein